MTEHYAYDIYGFRLAVSGTAKEGFQRAFRRFRTGDIDPEQEADLWIKEADNNTEVLPFKRLGDDKGMLLPFGEESNVFLYQRGIPATFILNTAFPLINWNDKCLVHAGVVSMNDRSLMLPALSNVGKTSVVLNLLKKRYKFIAEDLAALSTGGIAYPFEWGTLLPNYLVTDDELIARKVLGRKYAFRLGYKLYLSAWHYLTNHFPSRRVRWLLDTSFAPRYSVNIDDLFPGAKIDVSPPISHVFFLQKYNGEKVLIRGASADDIADRMAFVVLTAIMEMNRILDEYYKHVARGGKRGKRIEERFSHDREIILAAIRNTQVFEILIPAESEPKRLYPEVATLIDEYFNR